MGGSDDGGEDFFSSSPPKSSAASVSANGREGDAHDSPQKGPSAPPRALFRGDDEDEDEDDVEYDRNRLEDQREANEGDVVGTLRTNGKRAHESKAESDAKRVRIQSTPMYRDLSQASGSSSSSSSSHSGVRDFGQWQRRLLGTFIVPAWSLSKGPNYIQQGDKVLIQRQKPKPLQTQASPKVAKAGKKQTTLSFGSAAASTKKAKQKEDYIVRFSNMRGFEVGRIPTDISVWMSKVMDHDVAQFEGIVVDCPPSLTVGCDLLLEIKAYISRSAFPESLSEGISFRDGPNAINTWGSETAETPDEKRLRERKVSVVRLFRACTLRPSLSNDILKAHRSSENLDSEAMMEQYGDVLSTQRTSPKPNAGSDPKPSQKSTQQQGGNDDADSEEQEENDGTEMDEVQLENVYSKAQLHDSSLPEVEPAEGFALTLRPYQKQALGWMLKMEEPQVKKKRDKDSRAQSLHPLWEEYRFPVDDENMHLLDTATGAFYFNPYTGDLSLQFQHSSRGARGGILADEMGLGKTIQMASLILSNQPTEAQLEEERQEADLQSQEQKQDQGAKYRQMSLATSFAAGSNPLDVDRKKAMLKTSASNGKVTLVVAPMSLIGQWRDELERAIPSMTSMLYYAESKGDLVGRLEGGSVDVVITSYGTLVTEYKRFLDSGGSSSKYLTNNCPLYAVEWVRVILDEAHNIKNRATRNSRACCELVARRRWCLTGTPIVNRLTDLYSLLRFLRVEPWGDFSFFNSFISKPFAQKNPKAVEIVQVVLESVLMRREKKMKDKDGKSIVELPPKLTNVVRLKFSPLERQIYDSVYDRAYMQYQTLAAAGTISRNFSFIFSVLMRLRQAVCHPMLVLKGSKKVAKVEERKEHDTEDALGDKEEELKRLIADYQAGLDRSDPDKQNDVKGEALSIKALQELIEQQQGDGEEDFECPFCFEEKSEMCYLPCKHMGCRSCLVEHLQRCEEKDEEPACPTCRKGPVSPAQFVSAVRTRRRKNRIAEAAGVGSEDEQEGPPPSSQNSQPEVFFRRNDFRSSTKLEALVEHLNTLRYEDPNFKGVIFSQFTSFLDLVEVVLRKNHHAFVRLDGTTSQKDREIVLKQFSNAPKRMLMLISLRAGGVGLNCELTRPYNILLLTLADISTQWWLPITSGYLIAGGTLAQRIKVGLHLQQLRSMSSKD